MTTFEKHYIGKGTQVENLDIVRIVLPVDGLEAAVFEKNGVKYLSFEVAKLNKKTNSAGLTLVIIRLKFQQPSQHRMKNLQNKRKPAKRSQRNRPPLWWITFSSSRIQMKAEMAFFCVAVIPTKVGNCQMTTYRFQSHLKIMKNQIINPFFCESKVS